MMATFREAKRVQCPLCNAEPGMFCVSIADNWRKGMALSTLHNERLRIVNQAHKRDLDSATVRLR